MVVAAVTAADKRDAVTLTAAVVGLVAGVAAETSNHTGVAASTAAVAAASTAVVVADSTAAEAADSTAVADMVVEDIAKS